MKGVRTWKVLVVALVVLVVAARSSCRSVARWRGLAVMAPPRPCVRAGMRAAVLRLPPCVRAGTRAVEGRWRFGRCRARMPYVRAARPAAADFVGYLPRSGGQGMIQTGSK